MPKIAAQVSQELYKNINEEIKLGFFSDISEAVSSALRKNYAKKSRAYLQSLMKKEGVTKEAMLKELERIRK